MIEESLLNGIANTIDSRDGLIFKIGCPESINSVDPIHLLGHWTEIVWTTELDVVQLSIVRMKGHNNRQSVAIGKLLIYKLDYCLRCGLYTNIKTGERVAMHASAKKGSRRLAGG